MSYDFKDYTVVVTGGTRGIGAAVSEAFIKSGANVTAIYAGNEKAAREFETKCNSDRLKTVKCDVSDYSQVEAFFNEFDKAHKSLEVLVNCAGIRKDSVVGLMPPDDWNAVLSINLTGTYNMSKFALMKMMQNRFGRIISITSPSGKIGFAGQSNYASAKAGQVAFSKSLAKETAKRSITVNCVSPGFIDTDFIADLPEELRAQYKSDVPMKRFGKVEEVSHAILFLASREASYITGTVLEVTGGL
ncbi:MAG: beta-ketoacyl-ACP reductase [Lentisphaerae bacterium GWF2_44_16]|nr:MAG: beta-ketoacyl-ACP reductase [Lentisphaerae bacterium GWF2_44_16]